MRIKILLFCLWLCLSASCQTMQVADKEDFLFGVNELGKSYAQLKGDFQIRPPVLGFNHMRSLSVLNEVYWFEELPFEVVFVFDKAGEDARLLAVENICRRIDSINADEKLQKLLSHFNRMWGNAKAEPADNPVAWHWHNENLVATLSIPEAESGVLWMVEIRQNIEAPIPASEPLSTLGGWDRALYGNSLESLREIYNLGKMERSRLNQKPVTLLQNEVRYLGHPFQASFFFDRFTPQASLVGIDLYLLEDHDSGRWRQKRDEMIASLTKMYGTPSASQDRQRAVWVWKDNEGSLTLTDASKGERTTWLLSFRPPPGKIAPTPALSAPRTPQDIAGWGGARFGMSPAQVELLYIGQSPALMRMAGSGYGFERMLNFDLMEFKVLFLFDRNQRPPRLVQVVLTRSAPTDEDMAQNQNMRKGLLSLLTAWYGVPTQDLLRENGGGKAVWRRESGVLEFHDLNALKIWVLNFRVHN